MRRVGALFVVSLACAVLGLPSGAAPPPGGPRVVIVLDASLSMVVRQHPGDAESGTEPARRLDVAWQDLRRTVDHLARRQPDASVRLIVFGPRVEDEPEGLLEFPSAPGEFAEARDAPLDTWWRALADRVPRGPSRLDLALARALALAPDRVLCYTDGVPMASPDPAPAVAAGLAEPAAARIERARTHILANVRFWNRGTPVTPIDVVGVGAGLQGTRAFLLELAAQTGGYFVATD